MAAESPVMVVTEVLAAAAVAALAILAEQEWQDKVIMVAPVERTEQAEVAALAPSEGMLPSTEDQAEMVFKQISAVLQLIMLVAVAEVDLLHQVVSAAAAVKVAAAPGLGSVLLLLQEPQTPEEAAAGVTPTQEVPE